MANYKNHLKMPIWPHGIKIQFKNFQNKVSSSYPFPYEAMRSGSAMVREQFVQPGLAVVLDAVTGGHSEQVHALAVQRVAQKLTVVIHSVHRTGERHNTWTVQ